MNPEQKLMLQEALWYHRLEYNVIPLRKHSKKSLIKWEKYQQRMSTKNEIQGWWKRWPEANIGIVTGRSSGIFVLDVDGPTGEKFIKDSGLPPTPKCRTGRAHHYYLKYPLELDVRCIEDKDHQLGIKANGGYVTAPPSIHPSGRRYRWVKGFAPWNIEPVPLGKCRWLVQYIEDRARKKNALA